nr:MAG TPA: hypothetical protein [Caudoviricetes sp.]
MTQRINSPAFFLSRAYFGASLMFTGLSRRLYRVIFEKECQMSFQLSTIPILFI